MKTKLLQNLSALLLLILLFGCRNDGLYSTYDSKNQEEEFITKLSQSLSNNPDGKKIIERIKRENQKSNFIEKINKRNGEAKFNQKILKKTLQLNRAGKSEDSIVYLNIPFGNSEHLSSVLFIEFTSSDFNVKEIDNIKLEEIVYDESLSIESREQLLINYLVLDKSQYNTSEYINIPSTLFPELKENFTTLSKSFKIKNYTISSTESPSGRVGSTIVCVEFEDPNCTCHGTYWKCYDVGGAGGDDDTGTGTGGGTGGTGGNNGGGGGGTGTGNENPENQDPCTDPNSPWYTHSSCGNNFPNAVMTLSQKMDNYGYNISSYLQYLTSNPSIRIGFATYLGNHTNQQGAAFVYWGLQFLTQNSNTTWLQFEKWFIKPITQQDIISELQGYPCAQSILSQLPNLSNDIALAMRNIFQNNKNYNIYFRAKSGLGDVDGETFSSYSPQFNTFRSVIYLNDIVLQNATKEYILITMYHEVIHAFLDYEKFRLGDAAFQNEYPSVIVGYDYDASGNRVNRYTFLPQHNQLGTFLSQLENILSTYNPNLPIATVKAIAKAGITSMTAQEQQLNLNERNTLLNNYAGTKCP